MGSRVRAFPLDSKGARRKNPRRLAAEVATPVMGRAITAAVFAVVSIFWPNANAQVLAYGLAAFMVVSAKFIWDYVKAPSVPQPARGLYGIAALVMILSGLSHGPDATGFGCGHCCQCRIYRCRAAGDRGVLPPS